MDSKSRPSECELSAHERDVKTRADLDDKHDDLGDVEPSTDTKEDQAIHNQIQGTLIRGFT